MCGIAGAFHRDALSPEAVQAVRRMQSALHHRGPDGEGWFQSRRVALAHRRLSIIDLAGGSQPLRGEHDGVVAVVNGEIYNFVELRRDLIADGAALRTRSDCEVAPWLYERRGDAFVHELRGAFAMALWDEGRQRLLLVRDRLGEKPLAYAFGKDGTLYFASEVAALVASGVIPVVPDLEAIHLYFHYRFVPEPATALSGIRKLPAGCMMSMSPDTSEARPESYWRPVGTAAIESDPVGQLRDDLDTVGKIIVRSDVPIGVALSGGLDSSIVANLAARHSASRVTAFSVGYAGRPPYDERMDARAFAKHLGIDFVEVELSVRDIVSGFDDLIADMGEPIADPAGSSYRAVMRAAQREGIKVMFQGQGADELFWSYGWMRQALRENELRGDSPSPLRAATIALHDRLRRPPIGLRALAQWLVQGGGASDAYDQYVRLRRRPEGPMVFWDAARPMRRIANQIAGFAGAGLREVAGFEQATAQMPRRGDHESWRTAMLRAILSTYLLENGIAQADRYSMAAGVEARLPFVDYRLVEHAIAWSEQRPDAVAPGKAWLRAAVSDQIPPWVLGRPKRGFAPPTRDWVAALVRDRGNLFANGALVASGIVAPQAASELARTSGLLDRGLRDQLAYQCLVLEGWLRRMHAVANAGMAA